MDTARHVTFVVQGPEASPLVLCRMPTPEEQVKWKVVLKAFSAIARHYGARNSRQAICGLSGEDGISDEVIDSPALARLPRFELWKWDAASAHFILVRKAIS